MVVPWSLQVKLLMMAAAVKDHVIKRPSQRVEECEEEEEDDYCIIVDDDDVVVVVVVVAVVKKRVMLPAPRAVAFLWHVHTGWTKSRPHTSSPPKKYIIFARGSLLDINFRNLEVGKLVSGLCFSRSGNAYFDWFASTSLLKTREFWRMVEDDEPRIVCIVPTSCSCPWLAWSSWNRCRNCSCLWLKNTYVLTYVYKYGCIYQKTYGMGDSRLLL